MLLRHHGLGPKGSKAIAIALVVSPFSLRPAGRAFLFSSVHRELTL
jgi:hypothetical protein